ncbi:hypothetical protein ANN_16182 [Periplaneta americana]|uniref:Reverse transcriptase domain-containing protein n=1 Tax=Periplaneta americana TaxID=6978 RepID=A0ABQ8SI94_PERAM|nr:hypothetical protein ANN_16182 [Periplaneta americana]
MFVDIFMALVHSEDDIPLLLLIQELFFGSSLKNDAGTDHKEKKELVGSLAEKKLPTERCTGRNGERENSSGQKMVDDIKICGLYAETMALIPSDPGHLVTRNECTSAHSVLDIVPLLHICDMRVGTKRETERRDDTALLAEEMILRDMLLELNDSCEQYGMKINTNKTIVIERKIKKVNVRILNEAVELADKLQILGVYSYDTINRTGLYEAMGKFKIPHKLINLVNATMKNSQCYIKIQNDITEPLETKNGLKQRDSLACLLFNLVLEKVV